MNHNSFVFYRSFAEAVKELPAEEYKAVMVAIADYALDGITPECLSPVCKAIFILVKPQIDANNAKRESGRKGGLKQIEANDKQIEANTKQNKANVKQTEANVNVNNVNVNVKEKINKKKSVEPALEDALKNYERHRKQMKAPLTDRALELAINKLEQLAPGDTAMKIKIIDQSIAMGWKGLFPIKEQNCMTREDDLDRKLISDIQSRKPAEPIDWEAYFETG